MALGCFPEARQWAQEGWNLSYCLTQHNAFVTDNHQRQTRNYGLSLTKSNNTEMAIKSRLVRTRISSSGFQPRKAFFQCTLVNSNTEHAAMKKNRAKN